jgi:hypothetical protein
MEASTALVELTVLEQRDRLLAQLAGQRAHTAELWDWYRGQQELPDVPARYSQAYQLFLQSSITPWARLVVDAIAERLRVQGVRDASNPDAAAEAWRAFVRGRLNADQRLVYTEALITGTGYASVSRRDDGAVWIVPESSFEVTHEPDLGDRQRVAGALKLYPLDYGHEFWMCELYRPEATYRWMTELESHRRRNGGFPIDDEATANRLAWTELETLRNDVGAVPIVAFENRVNVVSGGASEIEDCIPVLQRIDRTTLDLQLASHYSSFRQKWATGLQVPRDPDTGQPIEPYSAAVSKLWVNENPQGSFGTFDASDLNQYLTAIDSHIASLAAISRVPAHYLMTRNLANPPSAESLVAAESGLVAKCQDRQGTYGESWETAFWLHAAMSGHPIEIEELEVVWVDAEKRSPSIVADAAVKLQTIGVPQEALWAYIGATPQQIAEWSTANAQRELLELAAQVQPPTAEQVEVPLIPPPVVEG